MVVTQEERGQEQEQGLMSITDAREFLEVSAPKMRELVRTGQLTLVTDNLDKRRRFIRLADLERIRASRFSDDAGAPGGGSDDEQPGQI